MDEIISFLFKSCYDLVRVLWSTGILGQSICLLPVLAFLLKLMLAIFNGKNGEKEG